jgi:hypothetical protein
MENPVQFSTDITKYAVCQIQSIRQILPLSLDVQKLKGFQLQGKNAILQSFCPTEWQMKNRKIVSKIHQNAPNRT